MPNSISPISTKQTDLNPTAVTPYLPPKPIITDVLTRAPEPLKTEWKPEKPKLTHPDAVMSEYRLLSALKQLGETGDDLLRLLGTRLSNVKDEVREISAENIQRLRASAERANASTWWQVLQKIATSLLSALSLVSGIAVISAGGHAFIGGAMIASGIFSLFNIALTESGTWDWIAKQLAQENEERREQLAKILPAAMGLVAGGIGLAGSAYSFTTGAIPFVEKSLYIAQTAFSIFQASVTLGKGQADVRLIWAQADSNESDGKLNMSQVGFNSLVQEIKTFMETLKSAKAAAKKAVENISETNIQLVRQA